MMISHTMISPTNSSVFGQAANGQAANTVAASMGATLTPTKAAPLGSIELSQESPIPEIKNRPLPLPLKHYLRLAMEQRVLRHALMERANQHTPKPR